MKFRLGAAFACSMLLVAAAGPAWGQGSTSSLQVGTGKADITPPLATLPPGAIIRDPLFARAIILRNDTTCAVLVGLDQGGTPNPVIALALPQVRQITGCPEANILISATHTHSGALQGPDGDAQIAANGIIAAVRQAQAAQQPAQIGFGTTDVDLNSNRDFYDHQQRWVQANNPQGVSDNTLAVIAFTDMEGKPIAFYVNYAMHPVNFYLTGIISADFAGGVSSYLEDYYGSGTVSIFSQGASGDQNPRLLGLPNNLMLASLGLPPFDDRVGAPPQWDSAPGGGPPPSLQTRDQERFDHAYADVSAGVDAMSSVSRRAATKIIEQYTGDDPSKHRWTFARIAHGKMFYSLLTDTTDPVGAGVPPAPG